MFFKTTNTQLLIPIVAILAGCAVDKPVITDQQKLEHLRQNTFINRYNTIEKEEIVLYAIDRLIQHDESYCLNGDNTFNAKTVIERLTSKGIDSKTCKEDGVRINFVDVFEPEIGLYTFKYIVWAGPLATSAHQCKMQLTSLTSETEIKCKLIWIY
ncbi:hypothetical protein R50072_14570 [Simiduia litorea]|uniref:hypothetical protein n=1 Tax=Simiduia litorea TaxID=1435348 RepID=UPI0036F31CD9